MPSASGAVPETGCASRTAANEAMASSAWFDVTGQLAAERPQVRRKARASARAVSGYQGSSPAIGYAPSSVRERTRSGCRTAKVWPLNVPYESPYRSIFWMPSSSSTATRSSAALPEPYRVAVAPSCCAHARAFAR